MREYDETTFGERIADMYDEHYVLETRPSSEKVNTLADLAGPGPILDVGCGTGQMASALASQGLRVKAVDSSPKMLEQLRKNDPDGHVESELVDITRDHVDGQFSLAYALFETIIMVGDHRAQQSALENIARSISPGGKLLLEFSVFDLEAHGHLIANSTRVMSMSPTHVGVGFGMYNREEKRLDYQDVLITENGIRLFPIVMHPTSPKEMTSMAQGAGFDKDAHWSDWNGTKYRNGDPSLIAVYSRRG